MAAIDYACVCLAVAGPCRVRLSAIYQQTAGAPERRPLVDGDMYRGRCSRCRCGVDLPGSDFWHRRSKVWRRLRLLRDAHRAPVSASAPASGTQHRQRQHEPLMHASANALLYDWHRASTVATLHVTPIARRQSLPSPSQGNNSVVGPARGLFAALSIAHPFGPAHHSVIHDSDIPTRHLSAIMPT